MQLLDNTLTPYPGQIGNGDQAALLASNGDGIHSLGASFGPLIKGNKLVNMGDDGITVHGLFFLVVQASNDSPPNLRSGLSTGPDKHAMVQLLVI